MSCLLDSKVVVMVLPEERGGPSAFVVSKMYDPGSESVEPDDSDASSDVANDNCIIVTYLSFTTLVFFVALIVVHVMIEKEIY